MDLSRRGDSQRHRLLVAVDFGTTFTGVAYCLSSGTSLEHINTVTTWPGSHISLEKIPTEICYVADDQPPRWGAEANSPLYSRQASGNPSVYGRFKLLLDPETRLGTYGELNQGVIFDAGDPTSKISLPRHKSAVFVSADYLRQLYKHIMENIFSKSMPVTLASTPIEFIFTVPAIWSHKAQAATKTAAELAGFGPTGRPGDTLAMVSEPEAAAVYAITALHEEKIRKQESGVVMKDMEIGDNFIICDAGGGTVDLITYEVQEVLPCLRLRESVVGSGGKCGSTFIDDAFHRWLRERIGPQFDDERIWNARRKGRGSQLMQKFEICKRTFGQAGADMWFLDLPVRVPDNEEQGIMDNEIELKGSDMQSMFDPVVSYIIGLVEAQAGKVKLDQAAGTIKGKLTTVILVGGFGESQYLFQRLVTWGECHNPPLTIVNPSKSWSAIMRGAVIQALRPSVQSRKLRSHYGIVCSTKFDERYHDISEARYCIWSEELKIDDNIEWNGRIGQDCSSEKLVNFPACYDIKNRSSLKNGCILTIMGSRYLAPPKKRSSKKAFEIGKLTFDFSNIDLRSLPQKRHGTKIHYRISGVIKMLFRSADVLFSFWIGNQCYGSARVSYDA